MKIGFDLDGVLYDFHTTVQDYYKIYKGIDMPKDEFWLNYFPSLSKEEQDNVLRTPMFYSTKFPLPSMMRTLYEIDSMAEVIFYITSRPKDVELTTKQYLRKHNFPKYKNVIVTDDKLPYIKLLKLTYFVDDKVEILDDICLATNAIQFLQPWNQHFKNYRVPVAKTHGDILKYIKEEKVVRELTGE